jgi:hypothetical protein
VRGKTNRLEMARRWRSLKRGGCDGGGSKSVNGDGELQRWCGQPATGRSRGGGVLARWSERR